MKTLTLSIVIPAHNEEANVGACLKEIRDVVIVGASIPCQIIVVDDNSDDDTAARVQEFIIEHPELDVELIRRAPPGGFGRAIRTGLEAVTGDAVVIYMCDLSDDAKDVLLYYRKLEEGYDCVFGSRFITGSTVRDYPRVKLIVNRIVNKSMQLVFWTPYNDLTNAFKAFRTYVLDDCGPFYSSHFNITVEMSLGAMIRKYQIAQVPISWQGRTWGSSNLRLREMGRKYLCVVLKALAERWLIADDLLAERLAHARRVQRETDHTVERVQRLERQIEQLQKQKLTQHVITSAHTPDLL